MNCATARQNLLTSEQPNLLPANLREHLAACRACRTVQRRLVRIERGIPHLPVPISRPPARLLEKVLHGDLVVQPSSLARQPDRSKEAGRQKVALAFALAASLAVFALGLWAWPKTPITTRSVERDEYVRVLEQKLPSSREPRRCVERLADLADEMLAEARPGNAERVRVLTLYFHWLMRRDLPYHASQLPPAERAGVLARVTSRLNTLKEKATDLANERPEVRASLRRIVAAIQDGDRLLQQLAEQRG